MNNKDKLSKVQEQISIAWRSARDLNHRFFVLVEGVTRYELSSTLFADPSPLHHDLPEGEVLTLSSQEAQTSLAKLWPERKHCSLTWAHARARLGGSEAALIVDFSEGCDPDPIGATLGSIKGGGLILFLAPSVPPREGKLKDKLTVWPKDANEVGHQLWERIWKTLKDEQNLTRVHDGLWISHDSQLLELERIDSPRITYGKECSKNLSDHFNKEKTADVSRELSPHLESILEQVALNEEQKNAVRVMINSHLREAFTAVAMSASRGRGKSSVMGIGAALFLISGIRDVWVTAPSEYACEALFTIAENCLRRAGASIFASHHAQGYGPRLSSSLGELRFVTPRALWMREEKPRLLLVDEAAALPVPLLERLLETKPSLVFATTTHGYEGTGRGFSLRFRPKLQRAVRKLYEPQLSKPLRWSEGDPAELWSLRALLLETSLPMRSSDKWSIESLKFERFSSAEIAQYPERYEQVFALLVNAHYRTQPSDLWRLLDAPNLQVHLFTQVERVVAAAIISIEGGLEPTLSAQLYEGRIRPRGQLFAANLAIHLNCEEGASLRLARVVRIATLPLLQNKGIGQQLLTQIEKEVLKQGIDLMGSSFGMTHQLMRFWLRSQFTPMRVSVRHSHVSGERSLLVAKPLTERGERLLNDSLEDLWLDFEDQLGGVASDLSPELAFSLLSALWVAKESALSEKMCLSQEKSAMPNEFKLTDASIKSLLDPFVEREWRSLGAVAFSGRAYELAARPARRLALCWLYHHAEHRCNSQPLSALGRLLVMKVIQGQRWLEVTETLGLGSTSEAMKGLSAALRCLYLEFAPPWALQWVRRFPQYDRPSPLAESLYPLQLIL